MKLFNLHIITNKEFDAVLVKHYESGVFYGKLELYPKIAEAHTAGYNEGKAEGIKASKKAFALALKQKGESNNDILRPN